MKNYSNLVFYSHINSGNHGCEAITKSTCKILKSEVSNTFIFSDDIELDKKCGLEEYGRLIKVPQIKGFTPFSSLLPRLMRKSKIDKDAIWKYKYKKCMMHITKDSLVLSTGGDVYCYNNSDWLTYLNSKSRKIGATTILWGCSIERNRIDRRVINDLKKYSLITVRESLTYKTLQECGINDNVVLYPDPAFKLDIEPIDFFNNNIVGDAIGLNLSLHVVKNDYVLDYFSLLIKHILENTQFSIVLIPHVYWEFENDLAILRKLYQLHKESNRVFIVDKELNCNQLKYIISTCKLFIGARTHSVIAAYSTCVPTLALGYSVKSLGIAKDIFGKHDDLVLTINEKTTAEDIIDSFKYLNTNKESIKNILIDIMPEYTARINNELEIIEQIKKK